MKTNSAPLPEDPQELKSIIVGCKSRIEFLEERVRFLQKQLFAPKSEKRREEPDAQQLHMFNEAEVVVGQIEEQVSQVPAHTRAKPKRKPLPENLPRVEVIHDLEEDQKVCACGASLSRIGEEVSEKLDIIPAKIQVIRHIRPKYACRCCEGVESEGPTVLIAPAPPALIPKGMATSGLVAHIAVSKYADSLPLYRQEKVFERSGIELSRSTMAGWMVKAAQGCAPLMGLFQRELLSGPLINSDETPVQVLMEPDRANTSKSYMWVFRGGEPGREVVLYRYSPTRSAELAREVLGGYDGYVQADAYAAYDGLGVKLVGCFAHARRHFMETIAARGGGKPGSAEVALGFIRQLYGIEKALRSRGLPIEEFEVLRRQAATPVLEKFHAWLLQRKQTTPPKGLLGKAVSYALNNWPKLVRYIECGHITPDNNAAENAIRPFVVGRKNWLFAGHPNGAHAASTLYSLIETAKACGLEPYRYLRYLFDRLPAAHSPEDYAALLPQKLTPDIIDIT